MSVSSPCHLEGNMFGLINAQISSLVLFMDSYRYLIVGLSPSINWRTFMKVITHYMKLLFFNLKENFVNNWSNIFSLLFITRWISAIPLTRNQHPCQPQVKLENGLERNEIRNQLSHDRTYFLWMSLWGNVLKHGL